MPDWSAIGTALADAGVAPRGSGAGQPVGGGDISAAWRVAGKTCDIFLKTGPAGRSDMFAAEADGLAALDASAAIRVPAVIATGCTASQAWIALEWLDLERPAASTQALLGSRLAAMHHSSADRYGWHRDNYIGHTPQANGRSRRWAEFWREKRLRPQFELASANGCGKDFTQLGDRLLSHCDTLLQGHAPAPALLHGDLWGGNAACVGKDPVVYDPAVYFGDREADLAMTRLFGGFGDAFYAAYEEAWPLDDGWRHRATLYQLYHVLNHYNLFGGGYRMQAEAMIQSLMSIS